MTGFRRKAAAWIAKTRPDCVVAHHGFLQQSLLRVANMPSRKSACAMCVSANDKAIAGHGEDSAAVAAGAVDILHTELRNGRLGIAGHAFGIVVPRRWIDGETVARKR